MTQTNTPKELSDEEVFRMMGERLALLLATADTEEDVRDAWAVLIPQMDLDQLEKLSQTLEKMIPDHIDDDAKKMQNSMAEINAKHEEASRKNSETTIASLKEIEDLIKSEES